MKALRDPVYFVKVVLNKEVHTGQRKWLANSNSRENLLVTGNRWGKSYVSALKILHRAFFRIRKTKYDRCNKYRIVTASITQDQANIIFNQTVNLARESEILEPLILKITRTPFPRLLFSNGALIEARSTQNRGEYLLGNDYDYFIFDEVAFESDPEYVVEEVIKMRLADREGMLDLVSTPNGKNWFYLRYRDALNNLSKQYVQSGDSRENSFISSEALKERYHNFSQRRVQQNIMGQFVDSGGEILKGAYVDQALENYALFSSEIDSKSRYYISGWDLARKRTATVGITVEVIGDKVRVVKLERFKLVDWKIIIEKIKERQIRYPGRLMVDATGLGDVIVEHLDEFKPEAVIFSEMVKAELLTNVEFFHVTERIGYERWELPDGQGKIWSLEDELRRATWDKNNDCDSLMALALTLYPLRKKNIMEIKPKVGKI